MIGQGENALIIIGSKLSQIQDVMVHGSEHCFYSLHFSPAEYNNYFQRHWMAAGTSYTDKLIDIHFFLLIN